MRPAHQSDFPSNPSRAERRQPAPITNLPVNALTSETDPTMEIRALIEQLQQAARDARAKHREAEQERDDLCAQLEQALIQVDELRANERELRANFTEITTIIRDRDQAIAAAERNSQAATRAHEELATIVRQRDDAQKLREEAFRQRDEAMHRLEGLTRAYSETGMRSAELQKQLATIRQARDSSHAQNLELNHRITVLDDEIAELNFQREAAKKAQQQAQDEATAYQREIQLFTTQRDAAGAQIEKLTTELDEQRKKFLDLAGEKSAIAQEGSEHAMALAEARTLVASLTEERDTARLISQAQGHELEKIRSQFHTFRETEMQSVIGELSTAREKIAAFEAQNRAARHDDQTQRQQLVILQEKVATLEVLVEDATAHQEEAEMQFLSATQQSEADRIALAASRQQLEQLTTERNSIRATAEQTRLELEAQLVSLREQASRHALPTPGADETVSLREMQSRFERQRLQTVELAAHLESTQRQVRELSASLAEARLQVKFANASATREPSAVIPAPVVARPANLSLSELLSPMRECFEAYQQSPGELSRLFELHDRIVTYAERARLTDCIALYRLAHVFASLLESLAAAPGQANVSTLNTIGQTVEFFARLRDEAAPKRYKDPAHSRVLVVDDDPGNCQCVQLVMQEQMIQTAISLDPASALIELASDPFDLVFLDVNMPHMDGFELCERLRELPLHATTPVVFLTGFATPEVRERALQCGGNDFLAKPFNLYELTVKAFTLILEAQFTEPA